MAKTNEEKKPTQTPPELPPEAAAESKKEQYLVVTASREGFRRAGYAFGKEPVRLALTDLTADQVAMLKAESMLFVREVSE